MVLWSRPSAFVRCIAVTGSFQIVRPGCGSTKPRLEEADQIAAEVAQADDAVAHLRHRQIHAVERHQPPGLEHAVELRTR
jgi:hypothetical protein